MGQSAVPPIPVERILEDVLDLSILWDTIPEEPGQSILAGLDPNNKTVVFNELRLALIEETPGLYNTVLGPRIGALGSPRGSDASGPDPAARSLAGNSIACFGDPAPARTLEKGRPTNSWGFLAHACLFAAGNHSRH